METIHDALEERKAVMTPASRQKSDKSAAKESRQKLISFEELLAHRESVFRICLGFSRNYAEAEDLAQSARNSSKDF